MDFHCLEYTSLLVQKKSPYDHLIPDVLDNFQNLSPLVLQYERA